MSLVTYLFFIAHFDVTHENVPLCKISKKKKKKKKKNRHLRILDLKGNSIY